MMADDTPVPEVLYKLMPERFADGDLILPFLTNSLIRFSPPGAMNDPLEVRGFVDNTDYKGEYDHLLRSELDRVARIPDRLRALSEKLKVHHVRSKLVEKHVSDPASAKANEWTRRFKLMDETFGILSLTKNISSSAMWSHYANRHFGVAIGFDFAELAKFADPTKGFSHLRPVKYTNEMTSFKLSAGKAHISSDIFFRKSKDWDYEGEWRIFNNFSKVPKRLIKFSDKKDRYGLAITMIRFNLKWIREIRLGVCATPETVSRVREFVREAMRPIKIFRMRASDSQYGLEEEQIV